jgi:predicted DsbA family dithiol-disulfide isomerase
MARASMLDVLVPVDDANEAGAGRVGGLGRCTRDRGLFDVVGEDDDVLTGLDAHPYAYGEFGQPLYSRIHARNPITVRIWIGIEIKWGEMTDEHIVQPLDDAVDHVRGPQSARLILEYGDYECPYSRRAYREIQRVEAQLGVRFAFRHFPLTEVHPHALAASLAAEAAAAQDRYWEMHDTLFHRQKALEDDDLRRYADELGLDLVRFDRERAGEAAFERVERDYRSGLESGQVLGTPTLFIDGVVHEDAFDAETLLAALAR